MKAKEETVKTLTELMMNIQNWHFKSRLVPGHPRIHESSRNELCISIDLYNFEGDGKPVCDGLNPCEVTLDDGKKDIGWLFCMCYDPDDEKMPLVFLFTPDEEHGRTHGDSDIAPENVPEEVLQNILKWLGEELKKGSEERKEKNDVTSFFFYMWNRWSEEECRKIWRKLDADHFWNKWCEAYDTVGGPRGAAELFYMMLSDTNRDKLVKRAMECYDGHAEKTAA